MSHLYWAVDCKTPGCDSQLFLKYLGIYEPNRVAFLREMNPDPVKKKCPGCGKEHEYTHLDVVQRTADAAPPADFENSF